MGEAGKTSEVTENPTEGANFSQNFDPEETLKISQYSGSWSLVSEMPLAWLHPNHQGTKENYRVFQSCKTGERTAIFNSSEEAYMCKEA